MPHALNFISLPYLEMNEATQRTLKLNRKKRGTIRASITKTRTRVAELEERVADPETLDHVKRLTRRLQALMEEFKVHHFSVIDLLDDEEDLAREQEIFDIEDEEVNSLSLRMERLISTCSSQADPAEFKIAMKRLNYLDNGIASVSESIASFPVDGDVCLIQQCEEQLSEYKKDFTDVRRSLLPFDVEDTSELGLLLARIEKALFDCALDARKLRHSRDFSSTSLPDSRGVKLPKLDVPSFDGNMLNWRTFWEQYQVAVHTRSNFTDSEKLAYLRHAVKAGTAKSVIEGLFRSREHYTEAIACLKSRYDKPRLIHQAHVRKIVEIPNMKDGSRKELRRLHDTALQHLRALRAMGHDPAGSFITSMLEMKLDVNTMFEWQKESQSAEDIPPYVDLLDFINLRAQASEAAASDGGKKSPKDPKKQPNKVGSYTGNVEPPPGKCVACKSDKHPLYTCSQFKSLSHEDKVSLLKSNNMCLNCLRSGHFVKGCKSLHRCRMCQKPHHTLLHLEDKTPPVPPSGATQSDASSSTNTSTSVLSHATTGLKSDLLMMTCRVLVESLMAPRQKQELY